VLVALELQKRIIRRADELWPGTRFLLLPPAFLGADTMPDAHSVDVDSRAIYYLLMATVRSLANQGFRYLLLTDNHGGPRHQIAIEKAVRNLYSQHDFCIIAPFNRFYRRMVEQDPDLLAASGTGPGSCGDDADAHGGTNETSLMLVVAPGLVLPLWKTLPRTTTPEDGVARQLLTLIGSLAGRLGRERLAGDLAHLGNTLSWLGMKPMPTYMGAPAEANTPAGEAMLEAHVSQAIELLAEVKSGNPPYSEPVLWGLRFIERS
jgi:creatinine amidohydrolase/Fe(II)-dependent formamide hydrolase-like protein